MKESLKIIYIGAGSFRFSTALFRDLAYFSKNFHIPLEVGLVDIDETSLKMMEKFFKQIIKRAGWFSQCPITITTSTNRRDLLPNANFVYKSISVGIQESDWLDNYLPLKFGIPQNTGDTVGPGGLFRGLRTVPVAAAIVRDMQDLCPNATLLNYSNPQASIVMAANTVAPNLQFVGLCHELFDGMKVLKKWYRRFHHVNVGKWHNFDYEFGGVNHFVWLTKFGYKGQDLYPLLRKDAKNMVKRKFKRPFNFYLLSKYNYYPYPGSRHVAEFLPKYYNYFNYKIQSPKWHFPVVRNVKFLHNFRKWVYRMITWSGNGYFWVPPARPSSEKAVEMMTDWYFNNSKKKHVVNLLNTNQQLITNLPADSVVEIPAHFVNEVISPFHPITLPNEVIDLVLPHATQTRFTVNAALGDDIDLVIEAMQHDPMANWIEDMDKLEYLTKLMLFYEQEWLPKEWQEWIPTKSELMESKWWVSPKELYDKNEYLQVKFSPNPELRKKAFFWNS